MPPSTHSDIRRALKTRLLALPPRAFELFAGELLTFIGLRNVAVTRYTNDGGIDASGDLEASTGLISIPTGVQVKRYQGNVPRADIDRFIGALSGKFPQGIFITTSDYAAQAKVKAATAFPHVATVNGDQVVGVMLQHRLGIADGAATALDEAYFGQFEAQGVLRARGVQESRGVYQIAADAGLAPRPEDDLISLRVLSHALRVDPSVPRRWIERGLLQPNQADAATRGVFFRRDRIEVIRTTLLGAVQPANAEEWRQEFFEFARSRNLSKSYKPVLLKALLRVVDRNGEAQIDALAAEFRAVYAARRQSGQR